MNNFCGIGRLGKDPELKLTKNGKDMCSFSIAIDRQFANADGKRETDWFNCMAFGGTAKFISQYFYKGRTIGITGSVQNRSWEGNDGQKHFSTEIVVRDACFTGQAKEGSSLQQAIEQKQPDYDAAFGTKKQIQDQMSLPDDSDLPFDL